MHEANGIGRGGVAALLSLLVHSLLFAAAILAMQQAVGPHEARDDEPMAEAPEQRPVRLGEHSGSPISISWITLPDPAPHAQTDPSEVTQAALRLDRPADFAPVPDSGQGAAPVDAQAFGEGIAAIRQLVSPGAPITTPAQQALEAGGAYVAQLREILGLFAADSRGTPAQPAPQPVEEAAQDAESGSALETVVQQEPGSSGGSPTPTPAGAPSDREADASSTIEALAEVLGSDISSEGLTIKTAKPRYFHYTTIMSSPSPAIARIDFKADGRVDWVELDPGSGVQAVDQALINVIFERWTASGPAIDALNEPDRPRTLRVAIRILF